MTLREYFNSLDDLSIVDQIIVDDDKYSESFHVEQDYLEITFEKSDWLLIHLNEEIQLEDDVIFVEDYSLYLVCNTCNGAANRQIDKNKPSSNFNLCPNCKKN